MVNDLGDPHALKAVSDADFVEANGFASGGRPGIVPAKTLLSQLL
jgi:hypothetical protein